MGDRIEGATSADDSGLAEGSKNAGEQQQQTPAAEAAPSSTGGKGPNAFSRAFQRAEQRLSGEEVKPAKPAEKPAAKAEDKPAKPAEKPAPKVDEKARPADKPAPKVDEKAAKGDKAAGGEDGAEDGDEDAEAEEKAKPLKPRRGWPRRLQEDFQYLTRAEQEERLAAPLEAPSTWDEESKATFAKLPAEAQDELIYRSKEIERGYQGKFEALAAERKLYEDIKAAVPPRVRQLMTGRNINEAQAFKALAGLQDFAMSDPVGYLADFIRRGNVDVNELADRIMAGDAGGGRQQQQRQQAQSVEMHPAFQALKADRDRLEAQMKGQAEQQRTTAEAQAGVVLNDVLSARDEGGELRYPFARVLSNYMADLYEADAESFTGLSPQDAFDLAYRSALDAHPELKNAAKRGKPAPSDDGERAGRQEAGDKRAERAKEAQTPKTKSPASAPASKGATAFSRAFQRAEKRLASRG